MESFNIKLNDQEYRLKSIINNFETWAIHHDDTQQRAITNICKTFVDQVVEKSAESMKKIHQEAREKLTETAQHIESKWMQDISDMFNAHAEEFAPDVFK
jgi:hypothetical protein